MTSVLEHAGLSFLRAFGASALTYSFGILAAPNLDQARLLATAAVVGSLAAGIRALQTFIPALSLARYLNPPIGEYADSFGRAFLAALVASLGGINAVPDLGTGKALVTAAIVGALAAGIKALQGSLTKGEPPAPAHGYEAPPARPA